MNTSSMNTSSTGSSNRFTWMGFTATLFAIVGLAGVFATYSVHIPMERLIARDQTLDAVLAAPNQAARDSFRDRLGESAPAVLEGAAPLGERVAAARAAAHDELAHEADAIARQARFLITVVTVCAAGFALAIGGIFRR